MDTIQPLHQSRTLDHSNALVENFWLFRPATHVGATPARAVLPDMLKRVLGDKTPKVIALMSRQLTAPALLDALLKAAQAGARVYVLSTEQVPQPALHGNCLLRMGPPLHGAFMLTDPGTAQARGLYFDDAFTPTALDNPLGNLVELDLPQCAQAFQFFCYHFWNSAKTEILSTKGEVQPIAGDPPFSVMQPQDPIAVLGTLLQNGDVQAAALLPAWPLGHLKKADLLSLDTLPDPMTVGRVNQLYAVSEQLPMQWLQSQEGDHLLPRTATPESKNAFVLALNPAQSSYFQDRFTRKAQAAERRFVAATTRADLAEERIQRIGLDNAPRQVLRETERQHAIRPDRFLPLDELGRLEPDFAEETLACKVTHKWTIYPFTLPANAKEDPLYEAWRKKHTATRAAMQSLEESLTRLSNSTSSIGDSIRNFLKQTLLGKNHTWTVLKDQLQHLQAVQLESLGTPDAYLDLIRKLNGIGQEVERSDRELQAQKQHAEKSVNWNTQNKQLESKIAELEAQRLANSQANASETAKESDELKARQLEWQAFLAQQNIPEGKAKQYKAELEQEAGGKNKKHPEKAAKAREMLARFNEADPSVLSARHKTDQDKRLKAQQQLEAELRRKKEELEKHAQNKPQLNLGADAQNSLLDGLQQKPANPAATKAILSEYLPEDLPTTGQLYFHDKQRYLAIRLWSEHAPAIVDARRLNAKLCVHP